MSNNATADASAALTAATITASATLAAATMAAAIALFNLVYQMMKDLHAAWFKKDDSYFNNLEKNYKMLDTKVPKLVDLATDMDQGLVMKKESKNTSTFKNWITRVEDIITEGRSLLAEYPGIKQRDKKKEKVSLSKRMDETCTEVSELLDDGKFMIAHFRSVEEPRGGGEGQLSPKAAGELCITPLTASVSPLAALAKKKE